MGYAQPIKVELSSDAKRAMRELTKAIEEHTKELKRQNRPVNNFVKFDGPLSEDAVIRMREVLSYKPVDEHADEAIELTKEDNDA